MSLNRLARDIHHENLTKGWNAEVLAGDDYARVPSMFMLMVSEIAEALEEYRNKRGLKEIYYKDGLTKPEGIPIELADTVIRILDFCGANGIDLDDAIEIKRKYNATRTYRHGGKVC